MQIIKFYPKNRRASEHAHVLMSLLGIFMIKNVIILNYNWCKLLNFIQKIEESLSTMQIVKFYQKNRRDSKHTHVLRG